MIEQQFQNLAKRWRKETMLCSSIQDMSLHPAYQEIIGMGPEVLPFIFKELEHKLDHWFWALREITQENPVSNKHRGNLTKMSEDWFKWAKRNAIKW